MCNGTEVLPIECQGSKLTTNVPVTGLAGDTIRQSVVTTKVDEILEAFRETSTARWQKAHHLLPSQWTDIADFVTRVARPIKWDFPEWSLERFVRIIRGKKSKAAVGPDGVTRQDLLKVPGSVQTACLQVLQQAEATAQWPRQLATGIVSLLEKHPQASSVSDYRPIVIYPILYRVWSTFRARQLLRNFTRVAPSGLRGGMPNQEARTIWYEMGLELETSHSHNTPLIGLVADLEKAFNHVPREPVWQILASLNVPEWLIKAWCGFVSFQVRRFRVRSTTGPMIASNCGYPEGCALSVAAMCFIDLALDWWMQAMCPQVRVYTFVDDWQFLRRAICNHHAVEEHLEKFVSNLDMIMDAKKTYVWATNSSDRKHLQQGTYALLPYAKTLGIQANYTQRLGNKTLVSRVDGMKQTWKQLRACLSPYRLKLKALLQLGWPKALHGVSSSTLAANHFGTLRTGAVRGLRTDRIGTSPMLHLSVWGFTFDPEGWSIYQTIKDARDLGSCLHFRSFVLQYLSGDRIPRNGPTSILISRLEKLGWTCQPDGLVRDEIGEFDLFQCPIDAIRQRVAWAWPTVMATEISHRACFAGMHQIDLAETRRMLLQYGEMDRVYLQCGLDGTMYTNRGKQHWQGDQANSCPFCSLQDGFEHRLWHCKHFDKCRVGIDTDTLEAIQQLPSCSRNHGWAIRPPSCVALAKALLELPTTPIISNRVVPPQQGPLHLFTDGTCHLPTEPALRVAAWSITQAGNSRNPFEFAVLASGLVSGLLQTAFRAELIAVREALTIASVVTGEVCIWSDCLGVITGVRRLQAMQWILKPSHSHYDLWSSIVDLLQAVGGRVNVVQVFSHISPAVGRTDIEQWAYWHNSLVDHAATKANEARGSSFWHLWQQSFDDLHQARRLQGIVATLLVKTGKFADQGTKTPEVSARAPKFAEEIPNQVQHRTPQIPQPTAEKFGFEAVAWVHQWWLSSGNVSLRKTGNLQWVSFLQLFIDYQLSTGCPGPVLVGGKWKFQRSLAASSFTYNQLCRWFQMLVKHYWKNNAITVGVRSTRPASASIGCWLVCAHLLWDQARLQRVEEVISQQQDGLLQLGTHIQDMQVVPADPLFQVDEPSRGLRSGM